MTRLSNADRHQLLGDVTSPTQEELMQQLASAQQKQRQQAAQIQQLLVEHEQQLRQVELERDLLIQSLMESEERYRIHISATMAVIWHSNRVGEFCVPQQSWQTHTGQAWPEHEGVKWIEMLPADDRECFTAAWQKQLEVGNPFTIECQVWSAKDSEYRHCEISAAPMIDASQNLIHAWVGSVVDIHERKVSEEQTLTTNELLQQTIAELQRSNMELDRFVYIASHDLKEPLRGMQNLATMLNDLYAQQLDDEGVELLTMIYESGNRMQQLITDLHNYSRVQLSHDGIQDVETDLLLDDIILEFQTHAMQIPFTIVRINRLPTVRCNPTHLQTIFKNLLANALKYRADAAPQIEVGILNSPTTASDHTVSDHTVSDHTASDRTVFYVRDNGIGIAAENHGVIFEMFKRLHAESEYDGGTGAGLAIVKKIIDQYSGDIWVESAPSQGSIFYFTLNNIQ